MTPSTLKKQWLAARTASAMRAVLASPELSVLKNRWPAFWAVYAPGRRVDRRSPAVRFEAEQLAAAEAALAAATAPSVRMQAAVARTYTRGYWLDFHGGIERKKVALAQARYLIAFAASGWVLDKQWLSTTVIALGKEIIQKQDYSLMPILADALQDAGCDNDEWLAVMRDPRQPWFPGARVVESLV